MRLSASVAVRAPLCSTREPARPSSTLKQTQMSRLLQRLAEFVHELIRTAANRGIEHVGLTVVRRIAQHAALADVYEPGRDYLLLDGRFVDAMHGVGIAQPRSELGGMVDDDVDAARLERR